MHKIIEFITENKKFTLAPGVHKVSQNDLAELLSAEQAHKQVLQDVHAYKKEMAEETEKEKKLAAEAGYEEGLARWLEQVVDLEAERTKLKEEFNNQLLPLVIKIAKKVVAHELEHNRETIVSMIKQSLKAVGQERNINIYCSPQDIEKLQEVRSELKTQFEQLDTLTLQEKKDLQPGAYTIVTEHGIIDNSDLDNLWNRIEKALQKSKTQTPE